MREVARWLVERTALPLSAVTRVYVRVRQKSITGERRLQPRILTMPCPGEPKTIRGILKTSPQTSDYQMYCRRTRWQAGAGLHGWLHDPALRLSLHRRFARACCWRMGTGWSLEARTSKRTPSREQSKPGDDRQIIRSAGWYGLRKGYRGRFGMYVPPLLEALGLAEVEHNPRNNRMRALTKSL